MIPSQAIGKWMCWFEGVWFKPRGGSRGFFLSKVFQSSHRDMKNQMNCHQRPFLFLLFFCVTITGIAQNEIFPSPYFSYGKGLGITSPDSLFMLNIRFRMQNRLAFMTESGTNLDIAHGRGACAKASPSIRWLYLHTTINLPYPTGIHPCRYGL